MKSEVWYWLLAASDRFNICVDSYVTQVERCGEMAPQTRYRLKRRKYFSGKTAPLDSYDFVAT